MAVSHVRAAGGGTQCHGAGCAHFWWSRDDRAIFCVATQFKPEELGLAADYLDMVSDDIGAVIEKWRKAWEADALTRC